MFSYYGSKTKMVNHYPKPTHDKIIEPFAGAAKYSLKYFEKDIILIDKYEIVIKIWKWLQQCSPQDILKLPNLKVTETLNDFTFDCDEAKWFMGYIVQYGVASPGLTPSKSKLNPASKAYRLNYMRFRLENIAANLYKIKHWDIRLGSFEELQDQVATWFVDPPYQFGGHKYVESNKNIDFKFLGTWCENLSGQVIVCENTKADWLDFKPMKQYKGSGGNGVEAIWSNEATNFDNVQQKLLI